MKKLDILAAVLLVVGGLNWGLVAVADFDLVATLVGLDFGETNAASRVIYGLVGLAAVYEMAQQGAIRRRWSRDPQLTTACGGRVNDDQARRSNPRRLRPRDRRVRGRRDERGNSNPEPDSSDEHRPDRNRCRPVQHARHARQARGPRWQLSPARRS